MLEANQTGNGAGITFGGEDRRIGPRVASDSGTLVFLTNDEGGIVECVPEGVLLDPENEDVAPRDIPDPDAEGDGPELGRDD